MQTAILAKALTIKYIGPSRISIDPAAATAAAFSVVQTQNTRNGNSAE